MSSLSWVTRGSLFVAALWGVCAVGACGGSSVGGSDGAGAAGGSSGALTASEFPARIAKGFCGELEGCCADAKLTFDRAACEALISKEFSFNVSMAVDGIAFDTAAAQRCMDDLTHAVSGCTAINKELLSDCDHLLVGTLPVGAPCTDGRACAAPAGGTAGCNYDASGLKGVCALELPYMSHAAEGDACSFSCVRQGECDMVGGPTTDNTACYVDDGVYCSNGLKCVALGALGAACDSDYQCAKGNYCDRGANGGVQAPGVPPPVGKCAALEANGGACVYGTECVSGACDANQCFHPPLATPGWCSGKPPQNSD